MSSPSRHRLAPLLLSACALALGCAGSPQKPESGVDPGPRDMGARLWRHEAESPRVGRLELELIATDAETSRPDAHCPGPFLACEARPKTWRGRLHLSLLDDRMSWRGDCVLEGLTAVVGTHVCGGSFEGMRVAFEARGDDLAVRLAGNEVFPALAIARTDTFLLERTDPLPVAFERAGTGGNRSSETEHLQGLLGSFEAAADRVGFASQESVRRHLVEAGVDPRTLAVSRLQKPIEKLHELRIPALRMSAAEREELTRELVEESVAAPGIKPTPELTAAAPETARRGPHRVRSVVLEPGLGSPPTPEATVRLTYTAWSPAGELLESVRSAQLPLGKLDPAWRDSLLEMTPGESRRLWLPAQAKGGRAIVDLRLNRVALLPAPPADPERVPEDALAAGNGLRYVMRRRAPDGARPGPEHDLLVRYTAWNAAGRVVATTAWEGDRWWRSLAFVGEESLTVAATNLLRVGEKGRFWIPAAHPARKDSRYPADEPAVFEVELLEIQ